MKPVLIMGVGNILLRDEGVGVRVIQRLAEGELPEHVELCDGGTSGADLIDVVAGRKKLIVVDAMDTEDPPGTVRRFTVDDLLAEAGPIISMHEFGLLDTLTMARQLDCAPAQTVIYGVRPEQVSYGLELTSRIEALVPRLIEKVLAEAKDY